MSSVGALLIGGGAIDVQAGWFGGFTDAVVMRAVDSVLSIPTLVLVSVVGSNVFGHDGHRGGAHPALRWS